MIKETAINTLIVVALGGGGMQAGKYYADHTYISMNAYQQSQVQQRTWSLQDQIKTIQRKAAREGRGLTTIELQDIEEIKTEIKNLEK